MERGLWLTHVAKAGLKELQLFDQTIAEPLPREATFHLESLFLDIPSPALVSTAVMDLLVAASRGSLRYLSVGHVGIERSRSICLEWFEPIADQLTKIGRAHV